MADFNVKVKNAENSSGFFGSSRGAQAADAKTTIAKPSQVADKTADYNFLGSIVQGAGSLFKATVDTADTLIKRDINERATEQTDQIFNEFGLEDASVFGQDVTNEPRPEEIGKAEQNLKRLHSAYQRGAVSESAYWARMESVSRQLRARYPGHRDFIDQTVSSIAGGKPANQIVRGLMEQASAARSAAGAGEKDRLQYLEAVTKAGFYRPGMENLSYTELLQETGPKYAQKQQIDLMKSQLDLQKQNNEAVGDLAVRGGRKIVNLQMMDMVSNLSSPFGQTYSEITARIREANASGKDLTVEEQTVLRSSLSQLKQDFILKSRESLLSTFGADLDSKQIDDIVAPGVDMITTLEQSLINKDFGMFNRMLNRLEAMKTSDSVNLMSSAPEVRAIATMNRELGPQATQIMMQANEKLQGAFLKTLVDDSLVNVFGYKRPMKEVFDELDRRGAGDPAAYRVTLDTTLSVLSDPTSTKEAKSAAAKALYSDGNIAFLSGRKSTDRVSMFNSMVNPTIYNSLKQLGDEEALANYRGWAKNSFNSLFRGKANDLRYTVENSPGLVTMNMQTGLLDLAQPTELPPGTSVREGTGDVAAFDRNLKIKELRPLVSEMNSLLGNLQPVLKDEGKEPTTFLQSAMSGVNIPLSATPNPAMRNVGTDRLRSLEQLVPALGQFNFEPQSGVESRNVQDLRGQEINSGFLGDDWQKFRRYYSDAMETYIKEIPAEQFNKFRDVFERSAEQYARKQLGLPEIPQTVFDHPLLQSVEKLDEKQQAEFTKIQGRLNDTIIEGK